MNASSTPSAAFETCIAVAKEHIAERDFPAAWLALERAHILGQPKVSLHLRSHWWMLVCAWTARDAREVGGQLVRLLLAAPGSALGRYPRGNTGRARVNMFRPMPIAPDLEALLRA